MKRRKDVNFRKQKLRERLRLSIYKSTKITRIEARRQIRKLKEREKMTEIAISY